MLPNVKETDICWLCPNANHLVPEHPECISCGGTWEPVDDVGVCRSCSDCEYCGAPIMSTEQVCREQGGDPPGTWMCSSGQ